MHYEKAMEQWRCTVPEEEDEFLSRLSVTQLVLGVEHSVAALAQVFRLSQILHEVLIRRTWPSASTHQSLFTVLKAY